MTFLEYWDSLFKTTATALVYDRAHNLFPVRLADRKVADHFFTKGTEQNAWREAVIDELVVCHIYRKEHDEDPRKAIAEAIAWNMKIALDPAVSKEAQDLYDKGIAEGRRQALLTPSQGI